MALYVVIPVYNHAEALDECLSSLYNQTVRPDQIIVVDDGSDKDNSESVARKWQDSLPIFFVRQENKGAPAARNRGFRGLVNQLTSQLVNYIIFCDADIVMRPDCLEKMKKTLEKHPEASYAYSSFRFGLKRFECGSFDSDRIKKCHT